MTRTDEDVEPMVDEEPPPRSPLRRVLRFLVLLAVVTVGIMIFLAIMEDPI